MGQRFFTSFPLAVIVNRHEGVYSFSIGGATESVFDLKLMIITVLSVALSALILVCIIYKMIQIRQRRFQADEWLQQNQAKLINYALMTKDEEMD